MTENLPGSLQYIRCDSLCNVTSSVVEKSDLFTSFSGVINLWGETYHLTGLVEHRSSHFIYAIAANLPTQIFFYFNDLQD